MLRRTFAVSVCVALIAPSLAAAQDSPSAPAGSTPLIAYVTHAKPPQLLDPTSAQSILFGPIATIADAAAGHEVAKDSLQEPANDIARELAAIYAAAKGGRVLDKPLVDYRPGAPPNSDDAKGANAIVDVEPADLALKHPPFDLSHTDLYFRATVHILDASGKTIASDRCVVFAGKTSNTRDALLADNGALLRQVVAAKAEACVAQMKSALNL
jgi:hypothetical protein